MKGLVFFLALSVGLVAADTPANCMYDDLLGTWQFSIGTNGVLQSWQYNCSSFTPSSTYTVTLNYPDVAVDENGNQGWWTLIYNQGFEIRIAGNVYMAFSKYAQNATGGWVSYCSQTMNGWIHSDSNQWSCFSGQKTGASIVRHTASTPDSAIDWFSKHPNHRLAASEAQQQQRTSWTAETFEDLYKDMDLASLLARAGARPLNPSSSYLAPHNRPPRTLVALGKQEPLQVDSIDSFDWRNVSGENFMSPIRDQGQCGSCYSFASMGMLEARFRAWSNNKLQPILSTQLPLSCSAYSQGCNGGFPYLVGGKFAHDFGIVEESCFPYQGSDTVPCQPCSNPKLWKVSDYYYVGGYYGASTPRVMQAEIMNFGPIAVSMEVYDDFMSYKGGVYVHNQTLSSAAGFNPFVLTNHVVVLLGWGTDPVSGLKYWIGRNSWGTTWGESGYFRIRREAPIFGGEAAIESITVGVVPILDN